MTNNLNDLTAGKETKRTSVRVENKTIGLMLPVDEYQHICNAHNRKNTLQLTFYKLLHELVTQLKLAGIGPGYDPDRYENAINQCTVSLGRDFSSPTINKGTPAISCGPGVHGVPAQVPNPEVLSGNDGRGAIGLASETPGLHDKPLSLPSGDTDKKSRVKGSKGRQGQGSTKRKSV